jgi:mono/diheme cytochrome c family protein
MPISVTATLGVVFLVLSFVSTYLMFRFWGYPYDKERRRSACPQWKMNIHRGVGYAYAIVYVVMMTQMVPRLWEYQVEFPARTVAHIMLGFTIGVLLIIKISILRWFRHFEEWMPVLGVALLTCTVLLSGLSLPFVVREQAIASADETFSAENRKRVRELVATAGFPDGTDLDKLAGERELRHGRRVLLEECTFCHDLRTAISRPRTPDDWVRTVERMVEKPTIGRRIRPDESHAVAAYLIAITPELQRSAKSKRASDIDREEALQAASEMNGEAEEGEAEAGEAEAGDEAGEAEAGKAEAGEAEAGAEAGADAETPAGGKPPQAADGKAKPGAEKPDTASEPMAAARPKPKRPPPDPAAAKKVFEKQCSKCHGLSDVDDAPPRTAAQARSLIKRMVENGMEASRKDIELIRYHLINAYVEKK